MGLGLPAVSSGFGRLGFQQVAMGFGCLGRSFGLVPCSRVGYHAVGDGRGPGCFRRSFGLASFALLLSVLFTPEVCLRRAAVLFGLVRFAFRCSGCLGPLSG